MKIQYIVLSAFLLSGCAGMNSDFQFSKPAQDSGISMTDANNLSSNGLDKDSYDISLVKLVNLSNLKLSVKYSTSYNGLTSVNNTNKEDIDYLTLPKTANVNSTINSCGYKLCYPEANSPFRTNETTARVWIAPYLSNNNIHTGEIVYFVAKNPKWFGVDE